MPSKTIVLTAKTTEYKQILLQRRNHIKALKPANKTVLQEVTVPLLSGTRRLALVNMRDALWPIKLNKALKVKDIRMHNALLKN